MLPYGRQYLDDDDIQAVIETLQSDWLTTGPMVEKFEAEFSRRTNSQYAVAVSSGTAALHTAMLAAGICDGDEVIVPAISFVATANAVVYCGGTPVFADVDPSTCLIDPLDIERKITCDTRAIIAMDYAGQPADYGRLREIADEHGLMLIADACHSLGGSFEDQPVGSLADMSCFSLHPLKSITAGEGGVVTTDCESWARIIRRMRNHGITLDHRQRQEKATHAYDMAQLGMNYRLTDIQCALAHSQLNKLSDFIRRRNDLAAVYESQLAELEHVSPLVHLADRTHARHLMAIRWNEAISGVSRDDAFAELRERGIGSNVHYIPIYRHSFYRRHLGHCDHFCPNADHIYEELLSLPLFVTMTDSDVGLVVEQIAKIANSPTAGLAVQSTEIISDAA